MVLLRQFWISMEKEKDMMQSVFLSAQTLFLNSHQWKCLEISSELGAQISRWSNGEWGRDYHFFETCLMIYGKKKDFGRRKMENEIERKRWRVSENSNKIPLFIDRVLIAYYLLYLFIFIILLKGALFYFLSNE